MVLPKSNVDSAVSFAHRRSEVPDAFRRCQQWNREYYASPDEVYDAEVLDEQEVDGPHLELAHPDVVDHEHVAHHGGDDDGGNDDALLRNEAILDNLTTFRHFNNILNNTFSNIFTFSATI